MKKGIQIVVGFGISALALYIAFKDVDLAQLAKSLGEAAWWPLIPFVVFLAMHFFFRSLRWRYLLPEPQREAPSLRKLFDSMILGNLATFILPFRLGEFIRPLVLARWSEYSFGSAFISVVIERFFDLSAVLISFAIVVQVLPNVSPWLHVTAYSLGGMACALLLFLVVGCLFPKPMSDLIRVCVQPLPKGLADFVVRFSGDLLKGAAVIKTPKRLIAIIALTVCVWITAYLQFNALLYMYPFNTSFLLSVALGVFVALAIAAPSAPGFLGVFQMGCLAALNLFQYPDPQNVAYAVIVHAVTYIAFVGLGFWLLVVHDLSLLELKKAAESGARD